MVIDIHTHLFPPEVKNRREDFFDHESDFKLLYSHPGSSIAGIEELISNMDEEGVDKSAIFGFPWRMEKYYKWNNDYIMNAVEKYAERFIAFATVSPFADGAENEIERCLRSGCRGIGEIALYSLPDPRNLFATIKPLADLALSYDVPLLVHTNEPIGHHNPGKSPLTIKQIYDLIKCFAENKFILAHWGGGILFYYLMKKEVKEVLRNTWYDTAASPFLYDKKIFPVSLEILGPEKILFGSDFPLIKPSRYFRQMKEAGLSADAIRKICSENAATLLNI